MRTADSGLRVRTDTAILHHEGHVQYLDACRKKAYYAPGVARFLAKHGTQGIAVMSQRPWLKQPRALASKLGVGMLVLKAGEVSAVIMAMAAARTGRRPSLPGASASGKNLRGEERSTAIAPQRHEAAESSDRGRPPTRKPALHHPLGRIFAIIGLSSVVIAELYPPAHHRGFCRLRFLCAPRVCSAGRGGHPAQDRTPRDRKDAQSSAINMALDPHRTGGCRRTRGPGMVSFRTADRRG